MGKSVHGRGPVQRLVVLPKSPMVDALMRRLEEASINASCAEERTVAELYLGGAPSVSVWVASAEDLERAARILRDVQSERTVPQCSNCKCDMPRHTGRTICPECGHDRTAQTPDITCPRCGEPVPADFDVCWSCGADVSS